MARRTRPARTFAVLALTAGVAVGGGVIGGGVIGEATATPNGNYVKTIRCDSPDPFAGPALRVTVDVWNKVTRPSDGLPGPAIELISNNARAQGLFPNAGIYTIETTVNWRNTSTGKRGVVRVPTRAYQFTWQAVIRPGAGRVAITINQKVGALVFVPMVNPQYSSCRTSVQA